MSSSRYEALSDEQWARIEPLLPSNTGRRGRRFQNNRRVVGGIIYRYRTGIPWRDLPVEVFGFVEDGVEASPALRPGRGPGTRSSRHCFADADAAGKIDWAAVSVDAGSGASGGGLHRSS